MRITEFCGREYTVVRNASGGGASCWMNDGWLVDLYEGVTLRHVPNGTSA